MAFESPSFDLTDEQLDDGTRLIAVRGEIHVSTASAFSTRLTEAIEDDPPAVVLDLSEVMFIDSTGLSVLLNGLRQVTRNEGRLALVVTNPTVLRLFEITRLDTTFDIQGTRAEALDRVRAATAPPALEG